MHKRFWARMVAMLLAISLLSATCAGTVLASSVNREMFMTEDETPSSATSAQVVQDILYVLLEDSLVSIGEDQEYPALVLDFSGYPEVNWGQAFLTSDGTCLYVLDPFTGGMYQVDGSTLKKIVTLDISKMGQELGEGSRNVNLSYPIAQNGFLYVLYTDPMTYPAKDLYRFSLQSGEGIQIPTHPYALAQITSYKEGQILGIDSNAQSIVAIDANTGKLVAEIGTLPGYMDGAVAYDFDSDKIYTLCQSQVMLWENKQPVAVDYLAVDNASDAIYSGIWKGLYTFVDITGLYTRNTIPGAPQAKTKPLTIWDDHWAFNQPELLREFMKCYPETPAVVRGIASGELLEKISTAILTGDSSIDIFIVPNSLIDGEEIFKRGFAYQLDSVVLQDDVFSMYPQIRDFVTTDGVLYGFPMALEPEYWTVRPELLEETQLGPIPTTVDDYCDMMLLWYENFYNSHPAYTFEGNQTIREEWQSAIGFLVPQYIYTYASANQPLSFNTSPFRSVLEKLSALSQWEEQNATLADSVESVFEKSIFFRSTLSPFLQSINPDHLGEQYILPPAFVEGAQPILETSLFYFIVNPYSQNKEGAIAFLEFFSQNMSPELKYLLHPDFNELIEQSNYQSTAQEYMNSIAEIEGRILELEEAHTHADPSHNHQADQEELQIQMDALAREKANFAEEQKTRWVFSAEAIAEYRKIAPYMNLEQGALTRAIVSELDTWAILSRFFQGSVTLDQALVELDRKVAMMFLEAQ